MNIDGHLGQPVRPTPPLPTQPSISSVHPRPLLGPSAYPASSPFPQDPLCVHVGSLPLPTYAVAASMRLCPHHATCNQPLPLYVPLPALPAPHLSVSPLVSLFACLLQSCLLSAARPHTNSSLSPSNCLHPILVYWPPSSPFSGLAVHLPSLAPSLSLFRSPFAVLTPLSVLL